MARPLKIVTITFDSFWSSGVLTIVGAGKANTFARSLYRNHKRFLKQYDYDQKWCTKTITLNDCKLKVKFETHEQPRNIKRRNERHVKAKVIL